jgi:hypothetical protein
MKIKSLQYGFSSFVIATASVLSVIGTALPASALDQDCTWTGATNSNFGNAGNWTGCGGDVPGTGDNLVFGASSLSADQILNNNIDNLSVKTITFQGISSTSYNYTISGNKINVTSGIVSNGSGGHSFSAPLELNGNLTFDTEASHYLGLDGAVSGSGNITWNSDSIYMNGSSTFNGTINLAAGAYGFEPKALPASTTLIVEDGATVFVGDCLAEGVVSIAADISLLGDPFSSEYNGVTHTSPKIVFGTGCAGAGGSDEHYGQHVASTQEYEMQGSLMLTKDTVVGALAKNTTVTGPIVGYLKITLDDLYGGTLVLNSKDNASQTPNGSYAAPKITKILSDDQSNVTLSVGNNAEVTLTGKRSDTNVYNGGTLKGTGSVAELFINEGGKVAPGLSPGCLTSTNLTIDGTYAFELGGADPCSGYDQLKANGTVNLDTTTSVLETSRFNGYTPKQGQVFTIIENDGSDAVTGTFKNLAEGATFEQNGVVFKISYVGGTGNDITLTVQNVPTAPDTGFALIKSNPMVTLLATIVAAAGLMVLARRMKSVR